MNKGSFGGGGKNLRGMQMAPKQDAKTRMKVIRRLLGYMFKHWYFVIPALLMTLFSNQLALLGPEYLGEAIDAIAAENGPLMDTVYYNFYKMLMCYAVSAVLAYAMSVIMVLLSQRIIYTMRRQLFDKLMTLPVNYYDTHQTGDIISRISYDIDTVNGILAILPPN